MIVSKTDPFGLRRAVRPGRASEAPCRPGTLSVREKPENVLRCQNCTVPVRQCRGLCRSDVDQERARRQKTSSQAAWRLDVAAVRRLAGEGMKKSEIARQFGVTRQAIQQALKRAAGRPDTTCEKRG